MAGTSEALRLGRMDRRLLPSTLLAALDEGWHGGRTLRDWLVDAAMFLLAIAVSVLVLHELWPEQSPLLHVLEPVLGVPALLAIWWRRQAPATLCVLTSLAAIPSGVAAAAALATMFTVAVHRPSRTVAWVLLASLLTLVPNHLLYPDASNGSELQDVLLGVTLTLGVTGWGMMVRLRRQQLLSLRDRALRAEADQRTRADEARRAERERIAREMHDVLAHRLSLVSLHAGALGYRPDAPPDEVGRAAEIIRASAHDALEELRAVIGVLREEDADGAVEPPQPGLGDVPALVEEARRAGTRVDLRLDPGGEPSPATGRTAYRIVQEGLTNARKHAPAARVEVRLDGRPGEALRVEVANPTAQGGGRSDLPGAGTGLIGLAERASLAGGSLQHDERDGRFVLRAELPWSVPA